MEILNGKKDYLHPDNTPNFFANTQYSKIPHSKIFKFTIALLTVLILLVGAFSLGIKVGLKKAGFAYSWSQNYSNNFGGPKMMPPPSGSQFFNPHGLDGTILSADKNTLSIKGDDNTEKTVLIFSQTTIRVNFQSLKASDLKAGQEIMVIGDSNLEGQIEAKFIRVLN